MTATNSSSLLVRRGALAAAGGLFVACLAACGCGPASYLAYLAAPAVADKNVPAEFAELTNCRVAIVLFADQRIQYEHPQARLTLAGTIRAEMLKKLVGVTITEPAKVWQYQNDHLNWETLDKSVLAAELGVDYVLYVTLMEYATREPGSIGLYRGRITAQCVLYKGGTTEQEGRVWHCDRLAVVYPEAAPAGVPAEGDRDVRSEAERLFADALTKKFYDHKEPVE